MAILGWRRIRFGFWDGANGIFLLIATTDKRQICCIADGQLVKS
jgi:hypothetical protein